jgi:cellulose synthase/poly-beta-1,6-N-acetylglucosamine synthase-like glycosyltransferase
MDQVMFWGGALYFLLFLFLFSIFVVVMASFLLAKEKHRNFTPLVSIIVPAYNEEQHIGACINALKRLAYPKDTIEIIVVDDGSTDNTTTIAKKAGVRVIQSKHEGKVAALNLGVKHAKHEILFTVDADTLVDKKCLKELIAPFADEDVGAATGNSAIYNRNSMLGAFQTIEYYYNNLIRTSFSKVFRNGIWFFGALACYRKSALRKVGFFKRDTLAEDMDTALLLRKAGYRTVNVQRATGYTIAPATVMELFRQRRRWWIGTLQSLAKSKELFSLRSPMSINFLFINQWWWSFYAFISLPLIAYQVNFWLPYNMQDLAQAFWYLFRWFTLSGPFYVLYKIPEWGISGYSIFGVLSGVISFIMIVMAMQIFKAKYAWRTLLAIFFYFPYTILLNTLIALSIIRHILKKERFFIS